MAAGRRLFGTYLLNTNVPITVCQDSRGAAAQYAPKQRELLMTFGADDPCPSCTCTGHEYDKLDILRQLVLLACAQVLAVCSYDRINTDHLEDMAAGLGEDSSMPAGCL